MFNKLREAIALAEAKEFEEKALDILVEESVFDTDIEKFMKDDIKEAVLTEEEIIDFDPEDPMNEFLMSESEDCDEKCEEDDDDDDEDDDEDDEEDNDDDDEDEKEDDEEDNDDDDEKSEACSKKAIKNEDLGDIIFDKKYNAKRREKRAVKAEAKAAKKIEAHKANQELWAKNEKESEEYGGMDKYSRRGMNRDLKSSAKAAEKAHRKAINERLKAEKAKAKLAEAVEYLEDVEFDDEYIYFSESDMEFLVDATDGVLSEDEILSEIKVSQETLNKIKERIEDRNNTTDEAILAKTREIRATQGNEAAKEYRKQAFGKSGDNERRQQRMIDRQQAKIDYDNIPIGTAHEIAKDQRKVKHARRLNHVQQPTGDEIMSNIKKYEEKKQDAPKSEVHAAPKQEAPKPAVEKPKGPMIDKTKQGEVVDTTTVQPKQVEVAKKGSSTLENIKKFGKKHQKGLKAAAIIGGAAAATAAGAYAYKKYKAKKAKEREEEQNKSEAMEFDVFMFGESAYITEDAMDFLLEACDYELTESEILDNIEYELNESAKNPTVEDIEDDIEDDVALEDLLESVVEDF